MKKLTLTTIGLLITTAAIGLFTYNINAAGQPEASPGKAAVRPVKTMTVTATQTNTSRTFPGTAKAASEAKIAFRVSGPIVEFDVTTGQYLKKGAVIARMDDRDYRVQISRIRAGIREARAGLVAMKKGARDEDLKMLRAKLTADQAQFEEAHLLYDRYAALLKEKAIANVKYDRAKAAHDMARAKADVTRQEIAKATRGARPEKIEAMKAKIEGLTASLKAAQNALADTVLTMPFSGFISGKFAQNHETVQAGMPVVSCIDTSSMEISVGIPEDVAVMESRFTEFTCTFDTYPHTPLKARLKETAKKASRGSKTYALTVVIDVPDGITVKAGMAADLTIHFKEGKTKTRFLLPVESVFSDEAGAQFVWIIDPETSIARKTRVTPDRLTGDCMAITGGLSTGDTIATAGIHFITEGQRVHPVREVAF